MFFKIEFLNTIEKYLFKKMEKNWKNIKLIQNSI